MTGSIIELCSRNRTEELEAKLEHDVEGYATRGLRALAVAYEELDGDDFEAEGNGWVSLRRSCQDVVTDAALASSSLVF
jgi:H+-transporting ATPase